MKVNELERWIKKVLKDKEIPVWVKAWVLELRKRINEYWSNV